MPTITGTVDVVTSSIKSRQSGTAFLNAGVVSNIITISSVNPFKSLITLAYGYALVSSSGNQVYVGDLGYHSVYYDFINETSVRFTRFQTGSYSGGFTLNFNWQLVEFN